VITSVRSTGATTNEFSVGTVATNTLFSLIQTSNSGEVSAMLQESGMMTMPQASPSSLILMQHITQKHNTVLNDSMPQSSVGSCVASDPVAGISSDPAIVSSTTVLASAI